MELYLTRISLDPKRTEVRSALRDVYQCHRLVMAGFPNIDERAARQELGVLWRSETNTTPFLLVQSLVPPQPGAWNALGLEVATKRIDDALRAGLVVGRTLTFSLRANPTRKIDTKSGPDGSRRNGRRVPLRDEPRRVEWLVGHLAAVGGPVHTASDLPDVRVDGETTFRGHRGERTLTLECVDFLGRLIVRDPDQLLEAVRQGVGPGKAFGMGLLMLAP